MDESGRIPSNYSTEPKILDNNDLSEKKVKVKKLLERAIQHDQIEEAEDYRKQLKTIEDIEELCRIIEYGDGELSSSNHIVKFEKIFSDGLSESELTDYDALLDEIDETKVLLEDAHKNNREAKAKEYKNTLMKLEILQITFNLMNTLKRHYSAQGMVGDGLNELEKQFEKGLAEFELSDFECLKAEIGETRELLEDAKKKGQDKRVDEYKNKLEKLNQLEIIHQKMLDCKNNSTKLDYDELKRKLHASFEQFELKNLNDLNTEINETKSAINRALERQQPKKGNELKFKLDKLEELEKIHYEYNKLFIDVQEQKFKSNLHDTVESSDIGLLSEEIKLTKQLLSLAITRNQPRNAEKLKEKLKRLIEVHEAAHEIALNISEAENLNISEFCKQILKYCTGNISFEVEEKANDESILSSVHENVKFHNSLEIESNKTQTKVPDTPTSVASSSPSKP